MICLEKELPIPKFVLKEFRISVFLEVCPRKTIHQGTQVSCAT